eukprot:244408-Rhodomonas_salina.4
MPQGPTPFAGGADYLPTTTTSASVSVHQPVALDMSALPSSAVLPLDATTLAAQKPEARHPATPLTLNHVASKADNAFSLHAAASNVESCSQNVSRSARIRRLHLCPTSARFSRGSSCPLQPSQVNPWAAHYCFDPRLETPVARATRSLFVDPTDPPYFKILPLEHTT